jgi:pimeloyl-ACP methyl ester carboxylesterase
MLHPFFALSTLSLLSSLALAQGAAFSIIIPPAARSTPITSTDHARCVITLIAESSPLFRSTQPIDGPFWEEGQPAYGFDVPALTPDAPLLMPADAQFFGVPASALPPGSYIAQARLVINRDNSNWRRAPGSLYSQVISFTIPEGSASSVSLPLSQVVSAKPDTDTDRVKFISIPSALLSNFHHRPINLRCAVVFPIDYSPERTYAALYHVPGFGGDHRDALRLASTSSAAQEGTPQYTLARNLFEIVLDPESQNGHTLFADSANNGPVGKALITELIPELHRRFPTLKSTPAARLLRGHSSGGWSTLWLATEYPDTFGACWSSSPDPVDFRRFQLTDIYSDLNLYFINPPAADVAADSPLARFLQPAAFIRDDSSTRAEICSFRRLDRRARASKPIMSARRENLQEELLGPSNTSGQQWDSWFAVFGPRDNQGHPASLCDPITGQIYPDIAAQYRTYDIADRLRRDPARYGPIFQQRIRLAVGDQDNFWLNEAVSLLKPEVEKLNFLVLPEGQHGYIEIIPGADHGSIFASAPLRAFPDQMIDHLTRNNLIPPATPAK